jgi:hypothetical protein
MESDDDAPGYVPDLTAWASVDPARHPFDPAGVPAVVRAVVPTPPPPSAPRLPTDAFRLAQDASVKWGLAATDALTGHYGDWALGWFWSYDVDHLGAPIPWVYFWSPLTTTADETLELVAEGLVQWRRTLERLAGHFDEYLPALRHDPSDPVLWEAALTHLQAASVAHVEDPCCNGAHAARVLVWFLDAAGIPLEHSVALVTEATSTSWAPNSIADVTDVAERIARALTGSAARGPGQAGDDWPDTWPAGWPSWRATNEKRAHS